MLPSCLFSIGWGPFTWLVAEALRESLTRQMSGNGCEPQPDKWVLAATFSDFPTWQNLARIFGPPYCEAGVIFST
jgi:hypothetical protein